MRIASEGTDATSGGASSEGAFDPELGCVADVAGDSVGETGGEVVSQPNASRKVKSVVMVAA